MATSALPVFVPLVGAIPSESDLIDDSVVPFSDQGNDRGSGSRGSHRGHRTTQFIAAANFVASNTDLPRGGSDSGPGTPFSQDEQHYICAMQSSIPHDAIDSFVDWLAGVMAAIMSRDTVQVAAALKDESFCIPKQASVPMQKASVIVHQDAQGIVVSTNPVWNACVSGKGLTLDLIRSNKDTYIHRQGSIRKRFAMTCRDYHRGDVSMWQHPDYPGLEIQLDTKGRLTGGLPTGFVAKRDVTTGNVAIKE